MISRDYDSLSLTVFPPAVSDESSGFGPVFEEQPVDTIYPEESPEDKIIMSCRTRANPPATYRSHLLPEFTTLYHAANIITEHSTDGYI